jgi:flagellar secretion chaperone FliS
MARGLTVVDGMAGEVSPLQVVVMMYDGALASMEAGKAAMRAGDKELLYSFIHEAEDNLGCLIECLDFERGGEMVDTMIALYAYVLNELAVACDKSETTRIDRCTNIMRRLRKSWLELEAVSRSAPALIAA